jgi:hypothetical protein
MAIVSILATYLTIVNRPPIETMLELVTMRKKNNGNKHLPNSSKVDDEMTLVG